jgi:AmmeMemoRadiSam system protein B
MDRRTLALIAALDGDGLAGAWDAANQVCCGLMPVLTVMRHAREIGCDKGRVLFYRNSGDDYPESRGEWVVGYGAVVFEEPAARR